MAQLRLKRDSTTALLCYCLASILMTVTNKVVLSQYNFRLNFLLLGVQGAVTLLLLKGSSVLQLLTYAPYNWSTGRQWFQVSLALVAMIYTGSKALQFLSIPLVTVFKNITIIIIAYFERFVYNGAPVTGLMLGAFGLMLTSSLISAYSDIYQGKWVKDTGSAASLDDVSQPSVFVAYFWMFMNCFTTAFYALVMRAKIKSVGFQDFDTVFYNNILSLPVLIILSLLAEGPEYVNFYSQHMGENWDSRYLFGLSTGILISSVSAFGISYATSWSMRVTSSTTYSMVGALNKLPIAIAGMLFFSDPVTPTGVMGVFLAFFAGILYSYAKSQKASPALPVYAKVDMVDLDDAKENRP